MRQESDFSGPKDIPDNAYWGVHSARAVENFPITGRTRGPVCPRWCVALPT